MKSKILSISMISVLMAMSAASNAGIRVSEKETNDFILGNEDVVQTWFKNAVKNNENYSEYLDALHSVKVDNHEDAKSIENAILRIMSTRYIVNEKWTPSSIAFSSPVMKNDSLIDMDRPSVGSVEFQTVKGKYYDLINYDSSTYDVRDTYLSSTLMRNGYPAIGPDAKPIKLCRLINSKFSSLYELSELESENFVIDSGSRMSYEDSCISYPGAETRYWKSRYSELLNGSIDK